MLRFAAVGIDHGHILNHAAGLVAAGAELAGYCPRELGARARRRLRARPGRTRRRSTATPSSTIPRSTSSASPPSRASAPASAIPAMRHGKDVMVDKPGVTDLAQLAEVRRAQAETGRIFSICFSERTACRRPSRAGQLVAGGRHRPGDPDHRPRAAPQGRATAPGLVLGSRRRYGGILVDIASHQIDQFLFFTGSGTAEVVAAQVGNFATPRAPGLPGLRRPDAALRPRHRLRPGRLVHARTGSPTWGDGRLTILGTEGYIELRKYVDIAGRAGRRPPVPRRRQGRRSHIDCSDVPLDYGRQLRRRRARPHRDGDAPGALSSWSAASR